MFSRYFLSKITRILFFLLLVVVGLFLLFGGLKDLKKLSYGERLALKIGGPVSKSAAFSGLGLRRLLDHYLFLVGVEKENELLRQRVAYLEAELAKAQEARLENERLRKLSGILNQFETSSPVVARVIGRPISSWQGVIIIDQGLKAGILPEMPVLGKTPFGPAGVVGQVIGVEENYAKVLLITDPSSAVDALIQRSRERGLLRGRGKGKCFLDYVSAEADVRKNDVVITSGFDALFPKGLLLGYVSRIRVGRSKGLFKPIEVKPAVNLEKIEEVIVLRKVKLK
ncbi:rod shape-determining protein MreC [Thermodesulfatator indicus DSM 15286]|uniref:Cell shape-determining protein MreC n=1 Tax=Thermodesulfatator indicus (strain DSM 15286 / JCM 11887 / CIR29812) TaxID=667014 RepID=F8A959_THEID|nr:rod shape-determining protein MreC [Thermodesulfatator indicus DSM 15286]